MQRHKIIALALTLMFAGCSGLADLPTWTGGDSSGGPIDGTDGNGSSGSGMAGSSEDSGSSGSSGGSSGSGSSTGLGSSGTGDAACVIDPSFPAPGHPSLCMCDGVVSDTSLCPQCVDIECEPTDCTDGPEGCECHELPADPMFCEGGLDSSESGEGSGGSTG